MSSSSGEEKSLFKAKFMLWFFATFKIRLIGYCKPRLQELNDNKTVIRIKLRSRTKNHLGSMYFGALAIGADLAGAYHAFYIARENDYKASIVFKDFKASFISRPEAHVYFESIGGNSIKKMLESSQQSKERVTEQVEINAYTDYYGVAKTQVAEFKLGLSVKCK